MDNEFEGSPRTWPPLGLPTGSIRAILTLIVVAVVVTRLARGKDILAGTDSAKDYDLLWVEALLIALSHYFTTRRFVELPPDILRQLESDGVIERERQPLYLPRNSIRLIIIGAFGWLAYYLYTQGALYENHAFSLIVLMSSYLVGTLVRGISRWRNRGQIRKSSGTFGDIKALLTLIAMLAVAVPEFMNTPQILPIQFYRVALVMMLFYFGSR